MRRRAVRKLPTLLIQVAAGIAVKAGATEERLILQPRDLVGFVNDHPSCVVLRHGRAGTCAARGRCQSSNQEGRPRGRAVIARRIRYWRLDSTNETSGLGFTT